MKASKVIGTLALTGCLLGMSGCIWDDAAGYVRNGAVGAAKEAIRDVESEIFDAIDSGELAYTCNDLDEDDCVNMKTVIDAKLVPTPATEAVYEECCKEKKAVSLF